MSLSYRDYRGAEIAEVIEDLARLRIAVFRDWPYLYDGDLDYERDYLARYAKGDSIVVAAFEGVDIVGASTGMSLSEHSNDFGAAFYGSDVDIKNTFYCAESVMIKPHRGRGAGHVFFDRREAHARHLGYTFSTFCSVIRSQDHPARPTGYRPLDPFWRARGYTPLEGVIARFCWRDIGAAAETEKPLQFWGRTL